MDEAHLAAAVRYFLLNPVRARLVELARDWPWSSLHAHLSGRDDGATTPGALDPRLPDIATLLAGGEGDDAVHDRLRRAECIGRPLGDAAFIETIETLLGRCITPRKPGRKPKSNAEGRK